MGISPQPDDLVARVKQLESKLNALIQRQNAPTVSWAPAWGVSTSATQTTSASLVEGWTCLVQVQSTQLRVIANAEVKTLSSKTGTFQLAWYPYGSTLNGTSTTVFDTLPIVCNNTTLSQLHDVSYTFPSANVGQLVVVSLACKLSVAGVSGEWVAYTPRLVDGRTS